MQWNTLEFVHMMDIKYIIVSYAVLYIILSIINAYEQFRMNNN